MTAAWYELANDDRVDVALLQEAILPPNDLALETIPSGDEPWTIAGPSPSRFCTAIARVSDRVTIRRIPTKALTEAARNELGISRPGTIAACEIDDDSGNSVVAASVYGRWEGPLPQDQGGWVYADASVHRIVSDLSALVRTQRGHRIVIAGDLNILHGYGERGSSYWRARYETIFNRMAAIGLPFVGPQHPFGEQADPWPSELPAESKNVPTFRWRRNDPATAVRQLDFVFASPDLAPHLRIRARNAPDDWGPSDHCRVEIDVAASSSASARDGRQ